MAQKSTSFYFIFTKYAEKHIENVLSFICIQLKKKEKKTENTVLQFFFLIDNWIFIEWMIHESKTTTQCQRNSFGKKGEMKREKKL